MDFFKETTVCHLPETHFRFKDTHKLLDITYQGYANRNHDVIPPTAARAAAVESTTGNSVGEDVERAPVHCGRGRPSTQPPWWRVLEKLNRAAMRPPALSLPGIYLKEMKTLTREDICTPRLFGVI